MREKSVFRVEPVMPVYGSPYHVVAADFGEAEQIVLKAENRGDLDCGGIRSVERVCGYDPENPIENQFIGF